MTTRWQIVWLGFLLIAVVSPHTLADELLPIELTLVDDHAIGYATFQSHNQKVVSNSQGIFITYLHASRDKYMAQTWRLAHSRDGGKSFETIYEATRATSAPVLETDSADNIYLAFPDFADGNAYLHRFLAPDYLPEKSPTVMQGGSAGKYAMARDLTREQLYFFAHNNTFHTLGLDGTVRGKETILRQGENAALQYPHLTLAKNGALYAAWTSSVYDKYLYWDIHAMRSLDAGRTWQMLDGKPLELPILADDTGPADRISGDDQFEFHTWLSAFAAKDEKLHFVYWAKTSPQQQRYVRYDQATGLRDVTTQPVFAAHEAGNPSESGLLAWEPSVADAPLFFVSTRENRNRVACAISADNGETWRDFAISKKTPQSRIYSIGGARSLMADGAIIGTFTDVTELSKTNQEAGSGHVYFYRIETRGR